MLDGIKYLLTIKQVHPAVWYFSCIYFFNTLPYFLFQICSIISKKSLECPLGNFSMFDLEPSFEEPSNLTYGFKIDGWRADLNQLSYDLDLAFLPIKVFPDPVVFVFEDAVKPFEPDIKRFEISVSFTFSQSKQSEVVFSVKMYFPAIV